MNHYYGLMSIMLCCFVSSNYATHPSITQLSTPVQTAIKHTFNHDQPSIDRFLQKSLYQLSINQYFYFTQFGATKFFLAIIQPDVSPNTFAQYQAIHDARHVYETTYHRNENDHTKKIQTYPKYIRWYCYEHPDHIQAIAWFKKHYNRKKPISYHDITRWQQEANADNTINGISKTMVLKELNTCLTTYLNKKKIEKQLHHYYLKKHSWRYKLYHRPFYSKLIISCGITAGILGCAYWYWRTKKNNHAASGAVKKTKKE